jgi:hypothetical protein
LRIGRARAIIGAMRLAGLLAVAALACGCASTTIVSQWENPADRGPRCARMFVVGVSQNATVRRIFEDEIVKAALARGVVAIQSYTLIQEDGPVPDGRLADAVQRAAAECVLTTRVLQVERRLDVVPPPPAFWGPPWGFAGWYGGAWGPAYAFPPQVVASDVVYAEVRLFRVRPDTLEWAATTQTFAPSDVRKESAAFAQLVFTQLTERKLV